MPIRKEQKVFSVELEDDQDPDDGGQDDDQDQETEQYNMSAYQIGYTADDTDYKHDDQIEGKQDSLETIYFVGRTK